MKKLTLTLCALAVAAFSASGFAQQHGAGQDMAAPSKPATAAEKDAARQQRRATSKEMVKKDEGRVESNSTSAASKRPTTDERSAARAKRQTVGKEAAKDDAGRVPDAPGTK